jgi:hypothetical protein
LGICNAAVYYQPPASATIDCDADLALMPTLG